MQFLENCGYLCSTIQVSPQNCEEVGGVFQTKVLRLFYFKYLPHIAMLGQEWIFILSSQSVKKQCKKNTSLEEFQDRI